MGTVNSGLQFLQFDAVTDYSDHYYANSNQTGNNVNGFPNLHSTAYKKIMKEWKILEENLPESVYVRVYEGRIDLLRAMIIGAPKTPYHDGLFFFDIAFPSNYPNSPPLVYYRSYGLRINPNLYANGYVCLSLLNTWHGKGNERWNPSSSTILQVLVSLQAIVLNERPYNNEPGKKPARSWTAYNRDVFALNCKTMLFVLRNRPRNFQDFIHEHFRDRATTILRACMAYRDERVSVGFFNDDGSSSQGKIKVSKKFKRSMDQLYGDLIAAFTNIGASLQNIEEEVKNDRMKTVRVPDNIVKKKSWIGSKFMMCFCVKEQELSKSNYID